MTRSLICVVALAIVGCNLSDPNEGLSGNNSTSNNGTDAGNNATTVNNSTTAPDAGSNNLEPLTVVRSSPEDGSEGLAPDTVVAVDFSEAVDADTVSADSVLVQANGNDVTAELTVDGTSLVIDFTPLEGGTTYDVTLDTTIAAESGATLDAPVSLSFTTAGFTVVSVDPMDGTENFPVSNGVTITMSEEIDPASVTDSTVVVRVDPPIIDLGEFVPLEVVVDGAEVKLRPAREFWQEFATTHTVTLSPIRSTTGLESRPFTTTFTTPVFAAGERYRIRSAARSIDELLIARSPDEVFFDNDLEGSEWGVQSVDAGFWALRNEFFPDLFLEGGEGGPVSLTRADGAMFFTGQVWFMTPDENRRPTEFDLPSSPRASSYLFLMQTEFQGLERALTSVDRRPRMEKLSDDVPPEFLWHFTRTSR